MGYMSTKQDNQLLIILIVGIVIGAFFATALSSIKSKSAYLPPSDVTCAPSDPMGGVECF